MVTREDVAAYARVSKSTVSRVLNNSGYVSKENRERIEKAIKDLGYTPNLIARSLKTKETRQILFFAHELSNPFYMDVYRGMEDYAEECGYTIVVSSHFDPGMVRQRQFEGIILSHIAQGEQQSFLDLGIPTVVTDYDGQSLSIPLVGIRMAEGAEEAVGHLVKLGHKRIALITNVPTKKDQRHQGYARAMEKAGLGYNPGYVFKSINGNNGYEQGYLTARKMIDTGLDVTAVFAFNDCMAIGVMAAFEEMGVKIPEDLSVIGFDDILQSRYTTPSLSTVRIPKVEQGRESVKMLLHMIKGERVQPVVLNTELVLRKSTREIKKSI